MIQAKELRVGNYVEYNGMFLQVSEIHSPKPRLPKKFDGVECVELVCDGFITTPMTDIKPIPLTEEILLKCGAEPFPGGGLILNHRLIEYAECRKVYYDVSTSVELRYLHQLQNLFYCLSGKELEVR